MIQGKFLPILILPVVVSSLLAEEVYNLNFVAPVQGHHPLATIDDRAFSEESPISPYANDGSAWNNMDILFKKVTMEDLSDSVGNLTAVSVSIAPDAAWSFETNQQILRNYAFVKGLDPRKIVFDGLEPESVWNLYLISQGDVAGQGGTFTVDGVEKSATGSNPQATEWVEGDNYVLFSNVEADSSGSLSIDWTTPSGKDVRIVNGAQLVRIPEPTTYAMIVGVAALTVCFLRRRNRR
ncbi:MAG: PEP-CTERM sorting domain-containing protein [Verrucomicrobiota bacterium]